MIVDDADCDGCDGCLECGQLSNRFLFWIAVAVVCLIGAGVYYLSHRTGVPI
jgi:hypothetical protein